MPSQQKKYLRQQAVLRADRICGAQKNKAKLEAEIKTAQSVVPPLEPETICKLTAPVHKPPPRKAATTKTPLQETNPNIRKLSGATADSSILIEGRNVKKSLARKKKAHHAPLLVIAPKVEEKRASTGTPNVFSTSTIPIQDENVDLLKPESPACHMVNEFPSKYLELSELASPKFPESSLESLDGFSGEFTFEAPQVPPSSDLDFKPPGLFKMPSTSWVVEGPSNPALGFIEGSDPTSYFAASGDTPVSGLKAPKPFEFTAPVEESLESMIHTSFMVTRPALSQTFSLHPGYIFGSSTARIPVLGLMDTVAAQEENFRPPSSCTLILDKVDMLVTNYPDIYAAALGRPTDILTPKLVALGRATAVAAYKADVQRDYAAAVASLEGLHVSPEGSETDENADMDTVDEDEIAHLDDFGCLDDGNNILASKDGKLVAPSSESSASSSDDSERGAVYQEDQRDQYSVFITSSNGHFRVVSETEPLYDIKVCNEQEFDYESVETICKTLPTQADNSDQAVPLLTEDSSSDAEASSSGYTVSVVYTLYELFGSYCPSTLSDDSSTSLDWNELTASSVESGNRQKWLTLVPPPRPTLPVSSTEPAAGIDSQGWLVLTPSLFAFRSGMTHVSSPTDQSPCPGPESEPEPANVGGKTSPLDHKLHEDPSAGVPCADDTSTLEPEPTAPMTSPDWTADLIRTMLGTESLFTFLSILDVDEDGSTTKTALVTAFLALVAGERQKLDLPAPPTTYTTSAVLASNILPHTTVLGTTSLATFLAHFEFGAKATVEAEEIYRVFKDLCKEETRKNLQVTTGIMSKLGRHLGKLSAA